MTVSRLGRDFFPRLVSACVLAPLALFALWQGGAWLLILMSVALSLGLYEWVSMSKSKPLIALLGIPYLALSLWSVLFLQTLPQARDLILYIVLSVWAVDSGAYFAGRLIGGKKLAPTFSPNKTWSGLFGGMAAASIVGFIWSFYAGAALPWVALPLGVFIGIVAQIGDIGESMMKRHFGVKDSGNLIPGHGGVLDRIDGLLLALPFFALFQFFVGQNMMWW